MWYQYTALGGLLLLFVLLKAYRVPKALLIYFVFGAGAQAVCLFFVLGGWYAYPIRPFPEIFKDNVLFNWVQFPLYVLILLRLVRPTWFQNLMLAMTVAMYAFLIEMFAKDHFNLIAYKQWSNLTSYFSWWSVMLTAVLFYKVINRATFSTSSDLGPFAFLRPGWWWFHLSMLGVFFYFLST